MAEPGQWETKLGWLGGFLAGQGARHVEVVNRDSFVTVAWETADSSRKESCFSPDELGRTWAPYEQASFPSSRSALLSELGREIDQLRIDPASIVEEHDGFVVTGSIRGRYEKLSFHYSELGPDARSAEDDITQPLVVPTQPNSPLRARLHLT